MDSIAIPPTTALGPFPGRLHTDVCLSERRAPAGANCDPCGEETPWIRRARGGDSDAFRLLVERHRDRAFEIALRIVRSREEAEEVAQDAFVRAWRALPGFREEARFSTWLYRTVTRRALDVASALKRRREREHVTENLDALGAASEPPTELPLARLERILAELTPVRRAVVTLFYLRECPVAEIAEILGLPAGTVKSHLHRSRAVLRRAWVREEKRLGLRDV